MINRQVPPNIQLNWIKRLYRAKQKPSFRDKVQDTGCRITRMEVKQNNKVPEMRDTLDWVLSKNVLEVLEVSILKYTNVSGLTLLQCNLKNCVCNATKCKFKFKKLACARNGQISARAGVNRAGASMSQTEALEYKHWISLVRGYA